MVLANPTSSIIHDPRADQLCIVKKCNSAKDFA